MIASPASPAPAAIDTAAPAPFTQAVVPAGVVVARRAFSPGVVAVRASLPLGLDPTTDDDLTAQLLASLLDKGTSTRSRHDVAEWLDARGASLSFGVAHDRLTLSGRALRDDLAGLLTLAADLLATPAFEPDEVAKARARLDAAVRSAEEDPGAHADVLLRRALFPATHPGHARTFDETRVALAPLDRDAIAGLHVRAVVDAPLTLALGGDTDGLDLAALAAPFGVRARGYAAPEAPPSRTRTPGRTAAFVPGTSSAVVAMGQGVALRRHDPAYLPLRVAVFALGGNFSSHLMQTVRDRDGLTYGVHASLDGVRPEHEGHVEVSVTLSPDRLEQGIETTRREVAAFVARELDDAAVARVATTLGGQQRVGLSTSGGAAAAQLAALDLGLGADYPDRFAVLVASVTADEATAALRAHVDPEAWTVALAGPVADAGSSAMPGVDSGAVEGVAAT